MSGNRFVAQAENLPPSSTQLFLENNLDAFLPSPSQEIRELLEDIEDFPSNTQIAKEVSLIKSAPSFKPEDDSFGDLFSTQDIVMSSQDLLEISTPSRPPPVRSSSRRSSVPPTEVKDTTTRLQQPSHLIRNNRGGRAQIMTPPTIPAQIARERYSTRLSRMPPPAAKRIPRTLPTSCVPKIDAIVPNVAVVKHNTRKHSMPSALAPPIPPKIPLPPPPKRRFFQEKEEDLFYAAIDESKRLECKRLAEEEERNANLVIKPTIPAPRTRSERTLQRVQSNATDYGDDDLISSQDLLALC
jgi:hypothetical protein